MLKNSEARKDSVYTRKLESSDCKEGCQEMFENLNEDLKPPEP